MLRQSGAAWHAARLQKVPRAAVPGGLLKPGLQPVGGLGASFLLEVFAAEPRVLLFFLIFTGLPCQEASKAGKSFLFVHHSKEVGARAGRGQSGDRRGRFPTLTKDPSFEEIIQKPR